MRQLLKPVLHLLKWPVRAGAFVVHFMHHLAAFFAWASMGLHVATPLAQAGWQANKIWDSSMLTDISSQGLVYFTAAGGVDWQKILALALIPAVVVAVRNAYLAYEQLHAWVHDHRHPKPEQPQGPA